MSLVLDDFYGNLPSVGVSSVTGSGMDGFFKFVDASVEDYERNYLAGLQVSRLFYSRLSYL